MGACTPPTHHVLNDDSTTQTPISLEFADSLWDLRSDSSLAAQALKAYEHLFALDSQDIDLAAKLSRACYFNAYYLMGAGDLRDSLYMRGYEVSQAIMNQDPQFHDLLFSTGDEHIAIQGLDERYAAAMYWGMANYGQWLTTKALLIRLGQRGVIWTTLEHLHDLDSTFYHGAYYRYKGALMSQDPDHQADTLGIRKNFERAQEIAPSYFGNNTLMATFYCQLTRDKALFYKLLTEVLTVSPDESLPYHPENELEKKNAERLMIKAEKENWFTQ